MDWSDGGWSTDVLFFFWGNGVYPKCRVLRKLSAASAERGLEQGSPLFQPWETHMLRIVDRSLHMLLSVSFLLWFIITMILYDHCSSASSSSSHYDDCDTLQTLHVFFCINFRHQKQHHGSIGHILPRSKVLGAVAGSKLLLCRGWWVFWENGQVLNSAFGENGGF